MLTETERFWGKVQKSDDCWLWTAACQPNGRYGWFSFQGRNQGAHRVAFQLGKGSIPEGMCVLHSCDNPRCVNPEHLRLGTNAENTEDARIRGRLARGSLHGAHTKPETTHRGERCSWAKLTEQDIHHIRSAYTAGFSQPELAEVYGVRQTTISMIVRRETWRHVA